VTKVGPYVFRQSLVQSQEGSFNGASLWKLGARNIAMLGIPNDYGKANMALTRRGFESQGGKIVFEEFVRPMPRISPDAAEGGTRESRLDLYRRLRAADCLDPEAAAPDGYQDAGLRLRGRRHARPGPSRRDRGHRGNSRDGTDQSGLGPELADFYKRYEARYSRLPDPFAPPTRTTRR
jgi:hypothetical protein